MPSFAGASLISQLLLLASISKAAGNNLFGDGGKADADAASSASASPPSRSKEGRIINGEEAEEDRFPYSVTLQDGGGHFCGGSLIGNDVVLTAAHCMGGRFSVRIGSDDVDEGELIRTRRAVVHPDYDSNTDEYDVALVFLERPTSLPIPLVRVNDDNSYPSEGATAVSMGWGDTDAGDRTELPDNLMAVDLQVITNRECENAKSGGESYAGWIYDSMICTFTKGKDACQGDSGGPLVVKRSDDAADDIQVGIVSWGIGCAFLPGVFSRISEAYDWTVDTVCDEDDGSNDPPASLCGPRMETPEPTEPPTTEAPTRDPTREPTRHPTRNPTRFPTRNPTRNPTRFPTQFPTENPTRQPTKRPTKNPTRKPTRKPTTAPTSSPTTSEPTSSPTERPTESPSISISPTGSPSASPTLTSEPTDQPTGSPSLSEWPSVAPSASPTSSSRPTDQPSGQPTSEPSGRPSSRPSTEPSSQPSGRPSSSSRPSLSLSPTASAFPSTQPSSVPSTSPSDSPTATVSPTASNGPTLSALPTSKPDGSDRTETIAGNTLLISDASALVNDLKPNSVKAKNSSHRVGHSFAVGTLLCCIMLAWSVL